MEKRRSLDSFHILVLLTAVFGMVCIVLFVLMFLARGMIVSTQLLNQRVEMKSTMGLDQAEAALKEILNETAKDTAAQVYVRVQEELMKPDAPSLSEEEALRLYRLRYCEALSETCTLPLLSEELKKRTKEEKGTVELFGKEPDHEILFDSEQGEMTAYAIKNVNIAYTYLDSYRKEAGLDYTIALPSATFYNGNDQLFEYSLIGKKGIYFTGSTSSVVGNLFAGTHSAEEYRKAEAGYGERKIYGGINLMATQLGVEADKIISEGDINLKGSFAAFGTDEKPVSIYANEINEIAGYFMHTNYTLVGNILARNGEAYTEAVELVDAAAGNLDNFSYYYDSENDETYRGRYRKILSNTDVTLSGDFTGAVMTSGNVIIEADCNVEGLIYALDRIYVRGNNNIVSNRDIMRRIIEEECAKGDADPVFLLKEYMGGMVYRGMEPCPTEMVAYTITK